MRSFSMRRREFLHALGATTIGAARVAGIVGPFECLSAAVGSGEQGITISSVYYTTITGLNSTSYILRLDTNKGISGYGECRCEDAANIISELNSMMSTVIGMNPTQVDKVFAAIRNTGNPHSNGTSTTVNTGGITNIARHTGAMCGIENACWDITGKVYNVPVWKLLGRKYRDSMRMYADTSMQNSLSALNAAVDSRVTQGFTWFKTDLTYNNSYPGLINGTDYTTTPTGSGSVYPYTSVTIKSSGMSKLVGYAQAFRNRLIYRGLNTAPLSSDHNTGWTGPNYLDQASANAWTTAMFDPSAQGPWGGWHEDIVPWWLSSPFTPAYPILDNIHRNNNSFVSATPILTGEDMYGFEEYKALIDAGAIDFIQVEQTSSGGIHQSLMAALYAASKGIKTVFHMSQSPFGLIANAHMAACIPDPYFLACEHHYPDIIPWYDTLVDGVRKPIMQNGYIPVPDGPGFGISPNMAALAAHGSGTWIQAG
jgi:L-alanine-DL-glutamate epimerase-like enolase superfamily enzyme